MSDPTPAPKRSRKKAAAADAADLVGVMAADGPATPDAASELPSPEAGTPEPPAQADVEAALADAEARAFREAEQAAWAVDTRTLRLERGGIAEATAGKVEVRLGGIGALDAEDVFVEWGGVGAARAERLSVEFGSVGAVLAGEARVSQGFAGSIAARDATLEQGIVRTLFAQHVTIKRPSAVLVLIAQHVHGDVRPVLDWRGALAFGAAFGLVSALVKAARERR